MAQNTPEIDGPVCPLPLSHNDKIVLGHGSGGKMSMDLIERTFFPPLENPILREANDAGIAQIILPQLDGKAAFGKLAMSTDSHVVKPLFFAGGDIGRLAVCGTVNDIAMMGAQPTYLTASFILEEGLDIELLNKILRSMRSAAFEASIQIIAGDTKVVEKGKADHLYINTTGVGIVPPGINVAGANTKPGDVVILSGTIGDHGIAVLEARGELGFQSSIESDTAPLNGIVGDILDITDQIHTMRDPTRGGLATSLNEIAVQSQVCIEIEENKIPVNTSVLSACELLGFDPLYIANEGKFILTVPPQFSDRIIQKMKSHKYGKDAVIIGRATEQPVGRVLLKTSIGTRRIVDILTGELLPRIC